MDRPNWDDPQPDGPGIAWWVAVMVIVFCLVMMLTAVWPHLL